MHRANSILSVALIAALPTLASATDSYPTVLADASQTIRAKTGTQWTIRQTNDTTAVTRVGLDGSKTQTVLPGRFGLPIVTTRGATDGASLNGSTLILAQVGRRDRFVAVSGGRSTRIDLSGTFTFDAVSPKGGAIYVTELVDPDRHLYWVRAYNLRSHVLGPRFVSKVFNGPQHVEGDAMQGLPVDRMIGPVGQLGSAVTLTIYAGAKQPFVHALNTANGGAICFDLPAALAASASKLRLKNDAGTSKVMLGHQVVFTLTL